ncbi:hypothetical protein SAMN05518672_103584 [Chitinophaga sp. CF118]|uniref:hypothetical protein n=1 Tax=Chitinophaga sp. CF118 TaxID=1884367 RepID=UPI0008EEF1D1|nr:hypothetical protein [Chitinophaga sp. CF118]SFD86553.1 hypothetical protein SAMN05518672_103584 [Chitinophaga sp. CF118]
MKNYASLAEALIDLNQCGYITDFTTDDICLYCDEFDIRLDPEDFHIDEVHEFESNAGKDAGKIIYAITSITGVKGTLVGSTGTYIATINAQMAMKLRLQHRK